MTWIEQQRLGAFNAWNSHVALRLHFKEGSEYDYSKYNGQTRGSIDSFMKKPKSEISPYMKMYNMTKGINILEFLIANFRQGVTDSRGLITPKAMQNYVIWEKRYGKKEYFDNTVKELYLHYKNIIKTNQMGLYIIKALELSTYDNDLIELVVWTFANSGGLEQSLLPKITEDIFAYMAYRKAAQIQSIYRYLELI